MGLPALRPFGLPARQLHELVEVATVPADQQLVGHHRDERRRQRHREPVLDAVAHEAVEHPQQGDVGLGEGLEEPVFLEEVGVLGVADVGQVRVEDRAPVPDRHSSLAPYRR